MEKVRTWCGHPSDRGRLKISFRISCNNFDRIQALQDEYCKLNENYFGLPVSENVVFDTELVSKVIADLKTGKAAGLTSILPVILSKLFNVIFQCQNVPVGFKYSYIVPVPKVKDS